MNSPTPTSGQDALYHVLHHILSLPEDGPVDLALVTLDCNTISDFLQLSTDNIALLQYPMQSITIINGEEACSTLDTPLPTIAKLKLCKFRKWAYHLGYIQDQDWLTFSTQDFNEFIQTDSTLHPTSGATTQSPKIDVEKHTFSHIKKDISHSQLDDLQEPGEQAPALNWKTQLDTAVSDFSQLAAVISQDVTRIAIGQPTLGSLTHFKNLSLQPCDLHPNGKHAFDFHHKTQLETIQEEDLYLQFDDLEPHGELVPDLHHKAHDIHVISDDKWVPSDPGNGPGGTLFHTVLPFSNNFIMKELFPEECTIDHTGAPAPPWLQNHPGSCFLLNSTADVAHNHPIPMWALTGPMSDIFPLLQFHFFECVAYTINNTPHSESLEAAGWWVGLAPNIDHSITPKILTEDMHNITSCSAVHSLASTPSPNKHLDAFGGEDTTKLVVETHADRIGADPNTYQAATFSSKNLIGAT